MRELNVSNAPTQPQQTSQIEQGIEACREHFNHLLSQVLNSHHQEAHLVEASIFKQLMQLGWLLLHVFFSIISRAIMAQRSKRLTASRLESVQVNVPIFRSLAS